MLGLLRCCREPMKSLDYRQIDSPDKLTALNNLKRSVGCDESISSSARTRAFPSPRSRFHGYLSPESGRGAHQRGHCIGRKSVRRGGASILNGEGTDDFSWSARPLGLE